MKVLLVNGSPHKRGCTYTALCAVSDVRHKNGVGADIFWIGNKPLSGYCSGKRCHDLFLRPGVLCRPERKRRQVPLKACGGSYLRTAGGNDGDVGSAQQVFRADADAYRHFLLLEHGARRKRP